MHEETNAKPKRSPAELRELLLTVLGNLRDAQQRENSKQEATMKNKLAAIEVHCASCAQCFNHLMTRLNETPPDSSLCAAGRQLMPRIGGMGIALALGQRDATGLIRGNQVHRLRI